MFIPVWKPGALIYTGDSHAVQGDGEICLCALETRMQELRIQVVLHKQKNFAWPIAETPTHWITLGLDKDLNVAMALAARNAINFLATRADLTKPDAYALCSIAISFRVTQVVDIVRGVHAMIPIDLCINNAIIGVQEQNTYVKTEGERRPARRSAQASLGIAGFGLLSQRSGAAYRLQRKFCDALAGCQTEAWS
jgi:Acetamidase/Formamidase family